MSEDRTDIGPEMVDVAENSHRIAKAVEEIPNITSVLKDLVSILTIKEIGEAQRRIEKEPDVSYARASGVAIGAKEQLDTILDNPDLDTMQRAVQLREFSKRLQTISKQYSDKQAEYDKERAEKAKAKE